MRVTWKGRVRDACSLGFIDDGHGWRNGNGELK